MEQPDLWLAALDRIRQQREAAERRAAWITAQAAAIKRMRELQDIRDLMRPG